MRTTTKSDARGQQEQDRAWMAQLISQAQTRRYYGKLVVTMEDGVIRRVVKEESLKPPSSGA